MIALMTLAHESGLSNAQLARRCFVTPQSMNEVVLELERRELLTREPDSANQRILRAHLTASGQKVIDEWEKRIDALEEDPVRGIQRAGGASVSPGDRAVHREHGAAVPRDGECSDLDSPSLAW